jgi:hypothetical protein
MTRGIWAGLALCAASIGCSGPQYYQAPPEQIPTAVNVGGTTVQIVDQRPEWEKKPFTGPVCMYHLGKAHPDAWAQLAKEADTIVAAMPQKPERVEVVVTSYRLVRQVENTKKFHDWGAGPNPNPAMQTATAVQANRDDREQRLAQIHGTSPNGVPVRGSTVDGPANKVEMLFASKDDPRRFLQEHPSGSSCHLQAKIRLIYPGGQEKTVDVNTLNRGENVTGTMYQGEAMDAAVHSAVFQFGRQFRAGAGLIPDQPAISTASHSQ